MEAVEVNTTEKEILMSLARLETKMDNLGNVKEVSNEALQSSKNAHLRLDRIDKIIFWAGTTIIGGVVIGAIGLLFYFAKN
jgi:Haemolysin XhlA